MIITRNLIACILLMGILLTEGTSSADTRADGAFLHHVTERYETPHLKWGKPLSERAPKVLFFVPRRGAREIVELQQRFSLTAQNIVTYSPSALVRDSVYENLVQGTSSDEKANEIAEKLSEEYDVIVLANVDFKRLSTRSQYHILEKVKGGTGLLFFHFRSLPDSRILSSPTKDWQQILRMVDVSSLFPEKNLPETLLRTYRFGSGRIGVIDYPASKESNSGAAALTAFEAYSPRGWEARYENKIAFVGRVIQWAAQHDISPALQPKLPAEIMAGESVSLPITRSNIQGDTLLVRIRDEWNSLRWGEEIDLKKSPAAIRVSIPPLSAGTHYIDFRTQEQEQNVGFGVFRFEVTSPIGNVEISTNKESYEKGEGVKGEVFIDKQLPNNARMKMSIQSLPDRKIWYQQIKDLPRGTASMKFKFTDVNIPSIAGAIAVEVQQGNRSLAKQEHTVYFARREHEIFPTLLWNTIPSYLTPMYTNQLMETMSNPAGLSHPDSKGDIARLTALANQRFVPYMTRIGLSAGKEGQTQNNHWLGMTEEEVEEGTNGEGSFNDPRVRAFWKRNIEHRITGLPRVGPMIYTLGDENNFSYDAGYSPADNAAWPEFLRDRYNTIEKLNQEWETKYADFTEVPHFTPQEMRDKELFPAWYEHRRFMEKQYADTHHFLAETIREIDPHALVGAEGSQPGELEQTISGLDFWGPYSDTVNDELLRSIGKDKLRMLWWGYGEARLKNGPYELWRPLLQGTINGSAFYTSGLGSHSLLSVDLSFADYFKEILPSLYKLNDGQAQTLIETPLKEDGIAILWSHASHSASFMNDRFFKPSDSATAFMNYCYRKGLNFDFITSKKLESGSLKDHKVLLLFGASALSEKEADSIKGFVRSGGLVIADINPGILSEYLRPLKVSRLAEVFGVPKLTGEADLELNPLRIDTVFKGQEIIFNAKNVFHSPETPVFNVHNFGSGTAVLLNFNLGSAHNTTSDRASFNLLFDKLLETKGINSNIEVKGVVDERLVVRVRENAENSVVGILAGPDDIGKKYILKLPHSGWVYEVNTDFVKHDSELEITLDEPFKLFSIFDKKQSPPKLSIINRKRASSKGEILLDTAHLSPNGIYRIDLISPDGVRVQRRTKFIKGESVGETQSVRFALNDVRGLYNLVLTDIRTGLSSAQKIQLKS